MDAGSTTTTHTPGKNRRQNSKQRHVKFFSAAGSFSLNTFFRLITGHGPFLARLALVQLAVAGLVTFLVGAVLQLNKLAVLDAAGRQFGQGTYMSKVSFLVPFAICKATSNLVVGGIADRFGRRRVALVGWSLGLIAPLMILSAPETAAVGRCCKLDPGLKATGFQNSICEKDNRLFDLNLIISLSLHPYAAGWTSVVSSAAFLGCQQG